MDSFTVICETCRARLRVRSASVIGEIHACPKCGSMVQIVPPANWSPPNVSEQPVGSHAPQEPATAAASAGAGEAAEIDTLLRQVATAGDSVPAAAPPPTLPAASPVSRWVLWSACGAGVLVVGGLLTAVWSRGSAEAVESIPPAAAVAETVRGDEDTPTTAVHQPDSSQPAEIVEPAATPPTLPEPPAREVVADTIAESSEVAPTDAEPAAAEPAADVPAPDRVASASEPTSISPESGKPAAGGPMKFDPLDFDPSQLNLSSSGVAEMVAPSLVERSEHASHVIGEVVADTAVGDIADSLSPSQTTAVQLGPTSSDALRNRDVAAQLSLKISAIDMPQVPLVRVLEMISDLADVPITLEPSALEMSGISPGFPVTLHAENVTIADLLTAALGQANLAYEAMDGQIVVAKPEVDDQRSVNYRVDDLVAPGATDASQMAEMIERFVAPDTWQSVGGTGTMAVDGNALHVGQTERVLYQVLTFCERLRLARRLPTRSRYPVDRLRIEPVYPQLAARLSTKTTFTFLPWSRLVDVLHHWEDAADLTVLVDWPALAEAGLAPSSPLACAVADRPWNDALDAVLTPLGLAWRAVDAETIQITGRDAASRTRQIEFYLVPERLLDQYANPEAMVAQLVDEAKKQIADGPPVEMAVDGPSGRLVVLAPPVVHRYLSGRLEDD